MAQLQETTVNGAIIALRADINTTASKTLALSDRDKVVACTNSGAITITIPNDSTVNFPVGSIVYISRLGTGTVTLAAAGGVTTTATGQLGEGEEIYCRKRAANNWVVVERPYSLSGSGGTVSATGNFSVSSFTTTGTSTFTVS